MNKQSGKLITLALGVAIGAGLSGSAAAQSQPAAPQPASQQRSAQQQSAQQRPAQQPGAPAPAAAPPAAPASDSPATPATPTDPASVASPASQDASPQASQTIQQQLSAMMGKSGGLTASQAAKNAVATSRDVVASEAEIVAAKADTRRVLFGSAPRVNLLARYTRLSSVGTQAFGPDSGALVATTDPPGPLAPGAPLIGIPAGSFAFPEVLNQYLLQASVTVPVSDYILSTGSAVDAAELNEESSRLNRNATQRRVAMQARLLYYEWVRSRLQVVVAEKSVEQAATGLRTSNIAFQAGRISKADVLNAESLLANAELRAERARTQVELSQERLRLAMHDPPGKNYEIGENLFAVEPDSRSEEFTALIAEAKQKRLELKALESASRSLSKQVEVSDIRGLPKLEAFGNAYYARPNQRIVPQQDEWNATWDVGLQLSWSPNDLGTSGADSRTLEAERAKLQARRDTIIDRMQQDILDAYMSLKEAELGVATAQRNLEAAEEAYRVQRLFFENGRGTTLQLLDSEARLLQARIEMVNVRVAKHMARVALDHAVGRDAAQGSADTRSSER